jgi:transcriptional regulator with XRE-family HTH domain
MVSTSPIRHHRENARMSEEDLALLSGMTTRYLDDLERGKRTRFTVRLRAMSHVLRVPVAELLR